jgi:hypothetical protein
MNELNLYMMLLGCRPEGRLTEQHDIFFGIADSMKSLIPSIKSFWPEAKGNIHVDAWRKISKIDNYKIVIVEKTEREIDQPQLFFINLGGYKPGEFDEFHYKLLIVAKDKSEAIQRSKQTAFYKHVGYKGAESHIDDKYGVDVDEVFEIKDILTPEYKEKYQLKIFESEGNEDQNESGIF